MKRHLPTKPYYYVYEDDDGSLWMRESIAWIGEKRVFFGFNGKRYATADKFAWTPQEAYDRYLAELERKNYHAQQQFERTSAQIAQAKYDANNLLDPAKIRRPKPRSP